jgi:hypothetical protein
MKKATSEKIALILLVNGILLHIPILLYSLFLSPLFLYVAFLAFVCLFSFEHFLFGLVFFVTTFIYFGFWGFGLSLLVGYYKHFCQRLNQRKTDWLWIKTICLNSLLFFPMFYLHLKCWVSEECSEDRFSSFSRELSMFYNPPTTFIMITCWAIAIMLSFAALISTNGEEK